MSGTALRDILAGRTGGTQQPVAQRLMAVNRRALYAAAGPNDMVPSVGYLRRMRALVAIGYTTRYLDSLGIDITKPTARVYASVWRRGVAVYDELWATPGPSKRSRSIAAGKGWAIPLAWDDSSIDDPAATPCVGDAGPRREALVEDVEFLLATAHGLRSAIERLGLKQQSLERALLRAGRSDLIGRLKRADREAS
jgi:hypothetical protein